MRPAHPCSVPNCSALVRGSARCPEHTITREERNPKDPKARAFYDSPQWRQLRAIVRRQQPICMICKKKPSTTVDHKYGRNDNRLESLQALCWSCHNRKSGKEHSNKSHNMTHT